jgi:hypothetical protein
MPHVGFEPTTPVFERAKMIHTLDRAVTVIGNAGTTGSTSARDIDAMCVGVVVLRSLQLTVHTFILAFNTT